MAENEKIEAVEKYLKEEFESATIEMAYDSGQKAHVFSIKGGGRTSRAVITGEFLDKNSTEAIPEVLRKYLLAEHLRECDFPLVVTAGGLTD